MTKSGLIVVSQIKGLAKVDEKQLSVSTDFYDGLNEKVKEIIAKACKRAKLNGRTTVMAKDI